MTTIYTGNTTTTGFIVESDTTGDLAIKTGGSGGTTAMTVGADQRVSFVKPPLTAIPTFSVELNVDQSYTAATDSKIRFDTTNFDTDSFWDGVNYRYTPQIAGYYQFNTVMRTVFAGGNPSIIRVMFFKNGSVLLSSQYQTTTQILTNSHTPLSHIIYCNGSTDYVEVHGYSGGGPTSQKFGGGGTTNIGGCFFSGFLVRPT